MSKKDKPRLPKRVAGMKVPKVLRKGKIGAILASPVGQAILLEQLIRVGDRLLPMGGAEAGSGLSQMTGSSLKALKHVGAEGSDLGARVTEAFNAAARTFVQTLREEQTFASPSEGEERERPAKKSSARSTQLPAAH